MPKPGLLIRADASSAIGTGHVMRCLALAQAWRAEGGTASFACRSCPSPLLGQIAADGFACHALPEAEPGSAEDARQTARRAEDLGCSWIAADGYAFREAFQHAAREGKARLLLFDDEAALARYDADLILNSNAYAGPELYRGRTGGGSLLLGADYALLRREILALRGRDRAAVPSGTPPRVVLTMGGADPGNFTGRIIDALRALVAESPALGRIAFAAVAGGGNPHLASLAEAARTFPSLNLEVNPPSFPELLFAADLVISAAGSTTWELLFLGTPARYVVTVENQRPIGAWLRKEGAAPALFPDAEPLVPFLREGLLPLVAEGKAEKPVPAPCGKGRIDGRGAQRLVLRMLETSAKAPAAAATP